MFSIDKFILALGIALLTIGAVLAIIGYITDYYASMARNPLDFFVLGKTQMEEINLQYSIGRTETITGMPIFVIGLLSTILSVAKENWRKDKDDHGS